MSKEEVKRDMEKFKEIVELLEPLQIEEQQRIVKTVITYLDISENLTS